MRKVAEVAVTLFITNDKPNIAGLVLAGSADFKTELSQSDMFDPVRFVLLKICFNACIIHLGEGLGVTDKIMIFCLTSL